jgi:hypothetical protein
MKRVLIALLIIIVVFGGLTLYFIASNMRPNIGPLGIKGFNYGTSYPAALQAALSPGPTQSDLIQRGLVMLNTTVGSVTEGSVDTGGINNLINSGIYFLNPQNHLQLGPVPGNVVQVQNRPGYIYAQRITQAYSVIDDFSYTGHSLSVTLPANLDLGNNSSTTHNLYNTHLTLPDGRWVEAGVGWVNWTTSPILYTFQSYTGKWNFASIPAGSQRDISLKIEIDSNNVAHMSASDPSSGKTVESQQQVGGQGYRIDLSQEQQSNSNTWLNTTTARFHNSQIKRVGSNNWENWGTGVISTWVYNSPLNAKSGTEGNQVWTDTWCGTQQ